MGTTTKCTKTTKEEIIFSFNIISLNPVFVTFVSFVVCEGFIN